MSMPTHIIYGYTPTLVTTSTTSYPTLYGELEDMVPLHPSIAMPHDDFDGECDYCHVRQNYNSVGICVCCGAPLK